MQITSLVQENAPLQLTKDNVTFSFINSLNCSKRDRTYLIKILFHVTKFFGIDTLIKLAHTSKKFAKIREIKFIINSQFRSLIISVNL